MKGKFNDIDIQFVSTGGQTLYEINSLVQNYTEMYVIKYVTYYMYQKIVKFWHGEIGLIIHVISFDL